MTDEVIPAIPAEEPVPAAPAKEPSRINRAFAGVGVAVGLIIWGMVFPLPLALPGWVVTKSHPRIGMFLGFLGLLLVVPGMLWKAKSVWGADWRKALPLGRAGAGILVWTWLCILAYIPVALVWYEFAHRILGLPEPLDPTSMGVLALVLGAPLSEEFLFRGYGLARIRELAGDRRALVYTAVIFALVHGSLTKLPDVFIGGLFLGWLVLRTGSLWPPLLAHFTVNATGYLQDLAFAEFHWGPPPLPWTWVIVPGLVGAVVLGILWSPQVRGRIKELAPRPGGGNPETMESQA